MLIEQCCAHCGQTFAYEKVRRPRIYCSKRCNWNAQGKKRHPRERAYRKRKPLNEAQLERRRQRERGKKRVRTPEQEARHKAAVAAWRARNRDRKYPPSCSAPSVIKKRYSQHLRAGYRLGPCKNCGAIFRIDRTSGHEATRCEECLKHIAREREWLKRRGKVLTCPCCNVQWCGLKQNGQNKTGTICSDACRDELRRAWKRARKRKLRGSVNRVRVFNRDGWKCRACGCDTPRHLMGSLDDDAPELDHVVPVALGGEHSYGNTQCLCRVCNLMKGTMSMDAYVKQWLRGAGVRATTLPRETPAPQFSSYFPPNGP